MVAFQSCTELRQAGKGKELRAGLHNMGVKTAAGWPVWHHMALSCDHCRPWSAPCEFLWAQLDRKVGGRESSCTDPARGEPSPGHLG